MFWASKFWRRVVEMVAGEPTIPVHITQYWGQRIADLTAERDALTVEVEALRSTVARIADIGNRKTDGNFATLCRLAEEVLRCAREATAEAAAQREALGEVMLHIPDAMLALAKEHPEQFAGLKAVQQLCDERNVLAERLKRVAALADECDDRAFRQGISGSVMGRLADELRATLGSDDGGR